jgi:hypothetical protein
MEIGKIHNPFEHGLKLKQKGTKAHKEIDIPHLGGEMHRPKDIYAKGKHAKQIKWKY